MTRERHETLILGGGVTGLAAGIASGYPVFEGQAFPGGICSSYYVRRGSTGRIPNPGPKADAYRFEHGGGHWIFGGHPEVLGIVERLAPCDRIARKSSVYFPDDSRYVGFPLQHHLHQLRPDVAARALAEVLAASAESAPRTMAGALEAQFGKTLAELFFHPFHAGYTAGLWREIAPQDGYKTPLDLRLVRQGALGPATPVGYNVTFLYPRDGLDSLIGGLAARADLRCGHSVAGIDLARREIVLDDGRVVGYGRLLSTLPLNRMVELTGIQTQSAPDPYTSVLVLNIGARRGPRCPDDHWLYIPQSQAGFHRVGFYSNVHPHFLPASVRDANNATCIYVERSFPGGTRPGTAEVARYAEATVRELQAWGFIADVEAMDPSWVDVAYTWTYPGSSWVKEATSALVRENVWLAGRYARWMFQGIADSLRDGFLAGQALRLAQ